MLLVENQTVLDIVMKDLGITIPASGTYDVLSKGRDRVATSDKLLSKMVSGDVKLIKDELANPYTYYPTTEAIRLLTGVSAAAAMNDEGELLTNMPSLQSEVGKKKLWVHNSAKPEVDGKQFYVQYTGASDDLVNNIVGGGDPTIVVCEPGNPIEEVRIEFCPEKGDTYIHEAYVMWEGAGWGDSFSVSIHSMPTQLQTIANKDLELENMGAGNFIKFAAGGPGTGTHGFAANPVLVKSVDNLGYWNYNSEDGLLPSMDRTGGFNIFDVDLEVNKFINRVPIFGTSTTYTRIESNDTAWVPPGYYLKVTTHNLSNNTWHLTLFMTLFREQTI